jgi:hypothetical protein
MIELTPSRVVALATLAAIAVGFASPAFAVPYRSGAERGEFVYLPADNGCISSPASCDLARY